MPSHLEDLVRARREKTGESYQQALRHIRALEERGPGTARAERLARNRNVADTAFSIAVVRAEEAERPEGERLFEDRYAATFAAAGAHVAESTQRFLDLPFFRDGVRLRTRFIDDAVRDGLAAGLDQVVLLGAGFDARGLRMPEIGARGASVYEVDTAKQLARKRKLLARAGAKIPARVVYVPFDFEDDIENALADALERKGFRRRAGAVFVWEGVIGYISQETIDRSLRFMAREGGPGSRLVFTFGESTFDPETAREHAQRAGFRACEEIAGDALWRRYLSGDPHPSACVTRIGTAIV
jgi:methyltransferase (TIGR00027 family)